MGADSTARAKPNAAGKTTKELEAEAKILAARERNRLVMDCHVVEDRMVVIDAPSSAIRVRSGEKIVATLPEVEDIKGHNGTRGQMIITSLRLIWHSQKQAGVNLCIGYGTVINIGVRTTESNLRGKISALVIVSMYKNTRYEFCFGDLEPASQNLFGNVQSLCGAYDSSRMYRDLRFRANCIKEKELALLPEEQIYERVPGAWNVSGDSGKLGTIFITNVRLVWKEDHNPVFNVTAPYIHILRINIRRGSKFGDLFILETSKCSGGYLLGFRIDPVDRMEELVSEMRNLHRIYTQNPVLGMAFDHVDEVDPDAVVVPPLVEVTEVQQDYSDTADIYLARGEDAHRGAPAQPVFSPSLGLAIEPLPDGVTIGSLWRISHVASAAHEPKRTVQ